MINSIVAVLMLLLSDGGAQVTMAVESAAVRQNSPDTSLSEPAEAIEFELEGLSITGHVRSSGLLGLFGVRGTLAFSDEVLIWTARGEEDVGTYSTRIVQGGIEFRAEHALEGGETAIWSGWYDGTELHDVRAEWTRIKGDVVHDLFLPERVVLHFTPDE